MFLPRKSPFEKGAVQNPKSRYFKPFEFFDYAFPSLGRSRFVASLRASTTIKESTIASAPKRPVSARRSCEFLNPESRVQQYLQAWRRANRNRR